MKYYEMLQKRKYYEMLHENNIKHFDVMKIKRNVIKNIMKWDCDETIMKCYKNYYVAKEIFTLFLIYIYIYSTYTK